MSAATLTTEDLLLGGEATHRVEVPPDILRPADAPGDPDAVATTVVIRPLVLADVQRIQRAAQDGDALTSALMVQQAMVEPKVTIADVNRMHTGLVEFLLHEINHVSGLSLGRDEMEEVVQAPLARASFVLAREFGWTPEQCAELTLGQILLYLEMLGNGEGAWTPAT